MLSNVIIEGKDHSFQKTILEDGLPIDRVGKTCTLTIQCLLDSYFWSPSDNQWLEGSVDIPTDASLGQGMWNYLATASSNFFRTDLGVTEYEILVTFTVIDDGTSETVFQDSEIMTIAKGTPLSGQEIANALSSVPEGDGFNPLSVNGMLQLVNQLAKYSFSYDFSTYSKAVMFFYDSDYPFTGPAVLWRYIYNANHGRPTNSSEIVYGDPVQDNNLVQPT